MMSAKDKESLVGVIMAGGSGTRFWPLSRSDRPKQFLKLFGRRSLLQMSFDRISTFIAPQRILLLTNLAFVERAKEQLPELPAANIIGEPVRRDTAAAVCLAALLVEKQFGNAVIVTMTADHLIEPADAFQSAVLSAAREASGRDCLYTFGVRPDYPATGYGYLEIGPRTNVDDGIEHFKVLRFKEKPDLPTAREYLGSGRYLWNSGMFAWTTGTIRRELERHLPHCVERIGAAVRVFGTPGWPAALKSALEPLKPVSIDYAVMEKARDVRCVAAPFSWKDVGSWQALTEFLDRDEAGNAFQGKLGALDSRDNLVFCEDPAERVALVGVRDLVVIRAGSRTLVVRRDQVERVKEIVRQLGEEG